MYFKLFSKHIFSSKYEESKNVEFKIISEGYALAYWKVFAAYWRAFSESATVSGTFLNVEQMCILPNINFLLSLKLYSNTWNGFLICQ